MCEHVNGRPGWPPAHRHLIHPTLWVDVQILQGFHLNSSTECLQKFDSGLLIGGVKDGPLHFRERTEKRTCGVASAQIRIYSSHHNGSDHWVSRYDGKLGNPTTRCFLSIPGGATLPWIMVTASSMVKIYSYNTGGSVLYRKVPGAKDSLRRVCGRPNADKSCLFNQRSQKRADPGRICLKSRHPIVEVRHPGYLEVRAGSWGWLWVEMT